VLGAENSTLGISQWKGSAQDINSRKVDDSLVDSMETGDSKLPAVTDLRRRNSVPLSSSLLKKLAAGKPKKVDLLKC
jgi:hypothetical protein